MSIDAKRLYNLLPAVYRIQDAKNGGALREFIEVIASQAAILEENLQQLYDNQFVETCEDWVLPYIGDLLGIKGLRGHGDGTGTQRAEVANTISYRRRKGTASVLEQLARDVTGWNARVVEYFSLLATTQHMNHIRLENRSFAYLRRIEMPGSPFDETAHTVDVRRIASGRGRFNIPNVGIFLWRLQAYKLTRSPAAPASKVDKRRFLFSPLGINCQLFSLPQTEEEATHLAGAFNVPMPISRQMLNRYLKEYYGEGRSLLIEKSGATPQGEPQPAEPKKIKVCDLSDVKDEQGNDVWGHLPGPGDMIAIDPVLGRIAFGDDQSKPPLVTFHYGFSADMGGGEYERAASFTELKQGQKLIRVSNNPPIPGNETTIQSALNSLPPAGGVVEITDNGRYEEALEINVAAEGSVELRASNEQRPTVVLKRDMQIIGGEHAAVTLNGLLITGGTLQVPAEKSGNYNKLRLLRLRHCTLVPGIHLKNNGDPEKPAEPSVVVEQSNITIEIDHGIVGGLRISEDAEVHITDSIVDATRETGVAYAGTDCKSAGGPLTVERSTIIGKVHTAEMTLASNSIFMARIESKVENDYSVLSERKKVENDYSVLSERKQEGCVRFCYLPEGSIVPRRYHCQQPDLAIQKAIDAAEAKKGQRLTTGETDPIANGIRAWLKPVFTDLRYGQPAYGQIGVSCPVEIRRGADDGAEMGAFHDLYQPQREANVRVRLDEYLRFGLEAGIFYVT